MNDRLAIAVCGLLLLGSTGVVSADSFETSVVPVLRDYCVKCHSTEKLEGELDLERFSNLAAVKQHPQVWEQALDQLSFGEMPPKTAPPLPPEKKQLLMRWIRGTLDDIALANAGDPGPVVLRRLSNHEFTYTLRDLTGIPTLDPAREFPVDGAAGEGFTNAGAALVMSPALLTKYLDAAKEVSRHLVLLPEGVRFSASDSPQDWTEETLARIRGIYARHTALGEGATTVQQGVSLDVGNNAGRLPLARYLDALQGRGSSADLSPKYLSILQTALEQSNRSILLDRLREKYRAKQLTAADVEPWQKVLWRFTTVGHIGKLNGPKAWQEPVTPLVARQELRLKVDGNRDQTIYLVASDAGDGGDGDDVVWENPRLVVKGRPDLPVQSVPELLKHLESQRTKILAETEACLAALAAGNDQADPEMLAIWREFLGFGAVALEPLIAGRMESTPDYNFIKGWTGANALSVLANSSDATVRIPGTMKAHSIATHPAPDRASVIAWKCPQSTVYRISGDVAHAHPECGNGIVYSLEVRRGHASERLAAGASQGAKVSPLGPFENVRVEAGQVVALVIGPRDRNHSCDLTSVNLTLNDGQTTWDLARDVSPNILAGNPHGPWHFLSQPASNEATPDVPEPVAAWRNAPSSARAAQVREHLEANFPLTHPLLAAPMRNFRASKPAEEFTSRAPAIVEVQIPAALATGGEFVVTGRLASKTEGSVQLRLQSERPAAAEGLVAGQANSAQQKALWSDNQLVTQHSSPVLVNDGSAARHRFEAAFDEFRSLFPIALCYSRIVPVDEVVTLTLMHREDDQLRRLVLDDEQSRELNRLWDELQFINETPLKQVDAYLQLWQYATQDADPKAFEPMREPVMRAAEEFKRRRQSADAAQRQAVVDFAARAWRRPITEPEAAALKSLSPRLMLVRVLASPSFLYRGEQAPASTGPVSDWELATRLSYFLWSSAPDDELRSLAAAGTLSEPRVLAAQTRRMLRDDRVRRLATEFGCQWLYIRDVASLDEKSERHFPEFRSLRADMQEEAVRFFIDLFQRNRDALSLLDADHTFVNAALARHYGLSAPTADWQRVEGLRQAGRGGVLGFAATLAKHSGASRTSAILRGTWLSEVVLGDKLPNPPKGVPVLPDEAPTGLTERQLIERHSSDAACAGCHRRIDPYGFALEGFDAIGRARPADTKTVLHDGTEVDGLADLRNYLTTTRRNDFLRQFCRKLTGYALGRGVQLSDKALIDAMVNSPSRNVADLIEQIVLSRQFREIRGDDVASRN